MRTLIEKWGNSLVVRLPKSLSSDAHLSEGTPVELQVEGDRLVITLARAKFELSELLSQFKPEHRHGEVNWGAGCGEEKL